MREFPVYYAFIKHQYPDTPFSFTKGLMAKLNKIKLLVEPYKTWVSIGVSKTDDFSACFCENCGSLWGQLGHCYDLIYWASGGLYWGDELKKQKEKGVFNGPVEFTTHIWKEIDEYTWESVYDLTFKGVKWLNVEHAYSDSGVSDCWATAFFAYEDKIKNVDYHPMECKIPTNVKYPHLSLGKLMKKHAQKLVLNES